MTFEWGAEWDLVADVVVVGTGASGGAAAAAASRAGAHVIILEKSDSGGGTTASSGGGMWIPNNFALREQGIIDERDRCVRYMARSAYPALYRPEHPTLGLPADRLELIETYFDHAAEVVDELCADGTLTLDPYHFPDYYSELPEAVDWGHSLVPRLPADWKRGDPGGGQLLADRLRAAATDRGARTLFRCRVTDVVRNVDGEVVGVEAHYGATTILVGARRGVVFGSGGFLHNERLVLEHLRGPILGGAAAATSTGDFVPIAVRAGAELGNMSHAWWDQIVLEQALARRTTSRDVFYAYGDSMIMVNRHGKRVLNEKASYTDRGQAHFYWDTGRHEYANRVMFMLFDDAVLRSDLRSNPGIQGSRMGRYPVPFPEETPSYLITGSTWDELADAIAQRLADLAPQLGAVRLSPDFGDALQQTIQRYNAQAATGVDQDFQRGESLLEKAWSSATRPDAKNDSMYPIAESGPFHCVLLAAGGFDTKGGPRTDTAGRVVDTHGAPIPGLYGAGNCVASAAGQAYWGPGTTIGAGLTFGYLAGRHAAAQSPREPTLEPRSTS